MNYKLEKNIYSDADFENLGWHDSTIYKLRLDQDLELDIDYIFKWNAPEIDGLPFTFWIAPATLVFRMPVKVKIDLDIAFGDAVEIDDIERMILPEGIKWSIITQHGMIEFFSKSFEQFIRQQPTWQFGQTISYTDRYGYSLERTTEQYNPNILKDDYLDRRRAHFDNYEQFKTRHLKKNEIETLDRLKADNKIGPKEYLVKKRQLKAEIADFDLLLNGTIFAT